MLLYSNKHINDFMNAKEDLLDKIENDKLNRLTPTKKDQLAAIQVVLDYIKKEKRKIYGGHAQNELIVKKNKKDAFYKDNIIPDIDVYSPDPLYDLFNICNILHDKGFVNVVGQEALHSETYKIFVDQAETCDISYVPKNIYYHIPMALVDGYVYTHPTIMMIDFYRILSEPFFSSYRWEKVLPRLMTLQKHYPFKKATSPIPKIHAKDTHDPMIRNTIRSFMIDNDSIVVVGDYAHNILVYASKICRDSNKKKNYKANAVEEYTFVSMNYISDVKTLLALLEAKNGKLFKDITSVEHYPFWSVMGFSTVISFKNKVLCRIIDYGQRCIPFKKTKAYSYPGHIQMNGSVCIGSFDYQMAHLLMMRLQSMVMKEKVYINKYNILISHLVELSNYFFNKTNASSMDDTLFQMMVGDCKGCTVDPMRKSRLDRSKKMKAGKAPMFRYTPARGIKDSTSISFSFFNSSGNVVNNIKNLRALSKKVDEDKTIDK